SEEHTSELQSRQYLVCRLLLEKKNDSAAALQLIGRGRIPQRAAFPKQVDQFDFFLNDAAPTEIYTLSLHDALPICLPVWATLVALERAGEVVCGVVSAPALGRRWWATRGGGAFADGQPIRVSSV